jgi:hypothetical protein
MATQKRIDGDYVITTINPSDDVIINTNTVKINGNLDVIGNLTYIETTELKVDDPFITVAANNKGTIGTATFQEQGLVTQTSASTFAGLRFNNGTLTWQISPSVDANGAPISAYTDIGTASAASVGGPLNSIQYHDAGNVFGGSAYYSVDTANSRVTLQGDQLFGNIGTAPTAAANSVALYHNQEGSGGTGLYVKSLTVEDELVSKTKAIVFGIIF